VFKLENKQKTWIIIGIVILIIALIGISNNFANPSPLNNNSNNSTSDPITSTIGTIFSNNNGDSSEPNGNSNNGNTPQKTEESSTAQNQNPKGVCSMCGGTGTINTVTYVPAVTCSDCGGVGMIWTGGHATVCRNCGGDGITQPAQETSGKKTCPNCGGSGITA
jgi:hypothetical protein